MDKPPLSKIELPDHLELKHLAGKWAYMNDGSLEDAQTALRAEFELAPTWKLHVLKMQRDRILDSLAHWQDHPECKPGQESYDWWREEYRRYHKMLWLLTVKISILTHTAAKRRGDLTISQAFSAWHKTLDVRMYQAVVNPAENMTNLMIQVGAVVRRDRAFIGVITSIQNGLCFGRITQPLHPRLGNAFTRFASEANDLVVLSDTVQESTSALPDTSWIGKSVKHKKLPRWGTVLELGERGVLIAIEGRKEGYPADNLMLAEPKGFWERKADGESSPTPFTDEWAEHVTARDLGHQQWLRDHNRFAIVPAAPAVTQVESCFQWFRLNADERDDLEFAYEMFVSDMQYGYDENPGWLFPVSGDQHMNYENFVDAFLMEYVEEYGFRIIHGGWELLGKPNPHSIKRLPTAIQPIGGVMTQIETTFKHCEPTREWTVAMVQMKLF